MSGVGRNDQLMGGESPHFLRPLYFLDLLISDACSFYFSDIGKVEVEKSKG